jgi:hypothetical protein
MGSSARQANKAVVVPGTDPLDNEVFFYREDNTLIASYFRGADGLLHYGTQNKPDAGPVVPTTVERFSLTPVDSIAIVHLDSLRVRATTGQRILLSSTFGMYNAWGS